MKTKKIFRAKITGHLLDPDNPAALGYNSWKDSSKTTEFTFAAGNYEEAIKICRSWGAENIQVGDSGTHNSEPVMASFVTIDKLRCDPGFIYV